MKTKLLSTLLLTVVLTGFAVGQNLVLTYEGETLENNAEVTKQGSVANEIIVEMDVTNNSSSAMDVLLQRYELDMVAGSQSAICWGGLCYPPNVSLSPSATTIGAGQTVIAECQLHYYPNGNPGVSTISYTLFDGANVNDSVSVIVHYDGLLTSIEVNYGMNAQVYPNPADDVVTIQLENEVAAGTTVEIINNMGAVVAEMEMTGTEARISTASLAEGMYFYRLKNDRTVNNTGRIIVQH